MYVCVYVCECTVNLKRKFANGMNFNVILKNDIEKQTIPKVYLDILMRPGT